jgi:hypothetical protein
LESPREKVTVQEEASGGLAKLGQGDMKIFLLLVAVWCWGLAFSSITGVTTRIILAVIGTAAFIWLKQIKPKTPTS